MNSLLKNIVEFIDVLRLSGVRVSVSESIDAVDALSYVNIVDKAEVKAALCSCLAKSETERKIFYEAFDRFFIDAEEKTDQINLRKEQSKQKKQEIIEKSSELKFKNNELNIEEELKEVYSELPENEKQSIRDFLEKTSTGKNVRAEFMGVAESVVRGKLNSLKHKYKGSKGFKPGILMNGESEAEIISEDVIETIRLENDLLYKDLNYINDEDMPKVIQLISQITGKLKNSASKSCKNCNKKGRLDFKKTIRYSMATGGIQFRLAYKIKPLHKQRILLLCDVSASMYRFSGFALQLITGLHTGISHLDSYIFSEDIQHLNIHQLTYASDIRYKVMESTVWGKGTDINTSITHILQNKHIVINSSTIVIIVSDAKTLNSERAVDSMKKLRTKVKMIYWLNPIREENWPVIPGIEGFKKCSSMMDCSTLEKLASACNMF